jgi:XTP/dITP diphosphohydrolase
MTSVKEKMDAFNKLLQIMDGLRANCPWDKEQTFESLRHLTIEETYELSEAILDKDIEAIKKELGDLMLHLVFYAKIGSEMGNFDFGDVLNYINEKLIFRHPHIYGEVKVKDARNVRDNWEKLKLNEGRDSVLSGVPMALPPLVKAYRIQEKAKGVGFDWEKPEQVWEKVMEELAELKHEVDSGQDKDKMEHELGDLLFAIVNYARFIDVNPEDALERTNKKFIHRFKHLENKAKQIGRSLKDMTLAEMDVFWEEAKKEEL